MVGRRNPQTLAEAWERLAHQLSNGVDEETLDRMHLAFYFGASAYGALLMQGHSCRREVEDFFATRPDESD